MGRTVEQQRSYMREYRAKKAREVAAVSTIASVTEITDSMSSQVRNTMTNPGAANESVEENVRRELGTIPVASNRPGMVAIMVALARVLDNRVAVPQHAPAARVLSEMIMHLRGSEVPSGNKLAQLRNSRRQSGQSA